jgi:hypothetical protein
MSFCKYSGWSEQDVKWKLSWSNYILYLSSMPTYDSEEPKKLEVKDSDDIF